MINYSISPMHRDRPRALSKREGGVDGTQVQHDSVSLYHSSPPPPPRVRLRTECDDN